MRRGLVEADEGRQEALPGERPVGRGRDPDLAVRDEVADLRGARRPHEAGAEEEECRDPGKRRGLDSDDREPPERAPHSERTLAPGGGGRRVDPASTRLTIAARGWRVTAPLFLIRLPNRCMTARTLEPARLRTTHDGAPSR